MSYRRPGEATTAGTIPNAWTQRRAAEFNAAMARYGASGVGAVVPMFRPSRPIAIPGLDITPRVSVSTAVPINAPGLDTSRKRSFGTVDPSSPEPPPVGPPPVAMMIGWGAVVAVAAGIFWAVTRPGSRAATVNKRRGRRSGRPRRNRRSRRNTGEIVVRYGQSADHRTPFYENWYSDGSRGKLTSTSDMSSARHEADRVVATLQKRGFSARARKESLTWANPRRKTTKRRLRLPTRAEVKKANAGTGAQRRALARKYGLSGYAAAAVGLKRDDRAFLLPSADTFRSPPRRRRRSRK